MLERLLCNLLNLARLFLDQLHDGEGVPSPMADVGLGLDDKPGWDIHLLNVADELSLSS